MRLKIKTNKFPIRTLKISVEKIRRRKNNLKTFNKTYLQNDLILSAAIDREIVNGRVIKINFEVKKTAAAVIDGNNNFLPIHFEIVTKSVDPDIFRAPIVVNRNVLKFVFG